jgi:hypothetical protein
MRTGPSTRLLRVLALPLAVMATLAFASAAHAVSGAAFTTINSTADPGGTGAQQGLCHNGNGNVNCNQYYSKQFVWINGGPDKNQLSDGTYFFAVLEPGTQHDPNDQPPSTFPKPRTDGNLSDDYDPYTNRTFSVRNGEITSYAGTHRFGVDVNDNNEKKIALFPYSDTTNNGGVYILAVCQIQSLGQNGQLSAVSYPVKPNDCKYDAFKILEDDTPPICPRPTFSFNKDGMGIATQLLSDAGGIDSIQISNIINLNVSPLQPGINWFQGTTSQVKLVATEVVRGAGSRIQILVTDVGGNSSVCDPVITSLHVRAHAARVGQQARTLSRTYHVSKHEGRITIRNGRPGLSRVTVDVNGKRFVARGLKAGERRTLRIGSALTKARRNVVTLRGRGGAGARADLMIAS